MIQNEFATLLDRLEHIREAIEALDSAVARLGRSLAVPPQEWFSIEEVAALTGLSSAHVRRHVTSGLLPASNQGSFHKPYYRIHRADVDGWMRSRQESPRPARRKAPTPGS